MDKVKENKENKNNKKKKRKPLVYKPLMVSIKELTGGIK